MSLALNLNNQIESMRRDKIVTAGSSWGRGFAVGLMIALSVMLPLFFVYMLTAPREVIGGSGSSGISLEQYASSPIPKETPKEYLGS